MYSLDKKITPKEEAFIQYYCSNGFSGKEAAISAGYSENSAKQIAYKLLTKVYLRIRLKEYQIEQAEKNGVKISEIIRNARVIVEKAENNDELNNMAKGNEQLGKTIGAFVDKTDINTKIDFNITDEDEKEI